MTRKQDLFADALRHHQAGRLADAEHIYREILKDDSRHADSWHLLGAIAHQVGRNDVAIDLIGKAILLNSDAASYHSNLGNALYGLRRLHEAIAAYRPAV